MRQLALELPIDGIHQDLIEDLYLELSRFAGCAPVEY